MSHWYENARHQVQTIITTELRNGGPRNYMVRVEAAQKAAIAAYKAAFENEMIKGQVERHVIQSSSFVEFYDKVKIDQVWQLTKKIVRRKKAM